MLLDEKLIMILFWKGPKFFIPVKGLNWMHSYIYRKGFKSHNATAHLICQTFSFLNEGFQKI